MKLSSIRINNYKSIGNKDNIMNLDDITIIIGKNESGKTNIIEAVKNMSLTGITDGTFFESVNKMNRTKPSFELELEPYKTEIEEKEKLEKMKVKVDSNYEFYYSGGMKWYIENDKYFLSEKEKLNEIYKKYGFNIFRDELSSKRYKKLIEDINNSNKKILIYYTYYDNLITRLKESGLSYKDELVNSLCNCIEFIIGFQNYFPTFFFINDTYLKYSYTKDIIMKNNIEEMLDKLLNVAKINRQQIIEYWNTNDKSIRKQIQKEINDLLDKNVSKKFNEFYNQEQISFEMDFDEDSIAFLLSTTDTYLNYSERSEGLKWYFNLFIKMQSAKIDYSNVIYIMDEPGIKLHINAQKELLNFFKKLVENNNQVLYSTHLPYMLYQDNFNCVRPIEKDNEGYTHIYNKYNSIPNSKSKMDTITPITESLGMSLKYEIGPSNLKLNIITEGISDVNYLKSFLFSKGIDYNEKYNLIPAQGANTIDKIVSILIGWGCDYFILLDNDREGRNEYKILKNKLCVSQDKICFTDGTNIINDNEKNTIENIFDKNDYENYIKQKDYNMLKNVYSSELLKKVISNEVILSKETINNFDKILSKIK